MTRIYWDAMLFIYLIEGNPQFGPRVRTIWGAIQERQQILCTAFLTVGEVLTGPYKKGDLAMGAAIRDLMRPPHVELLPFDESAAERYAETRAKWGVAPADAIHLASAARAGVDLFLTNDHRLTKISIPGIDFIAGMDVNLF